MTEDASDLARIEALLEERLGLSSASLRLSAQLDELLRRRAEERRCSGLDDYLKALSRPELAREELRALADLVTIGESYFFREPRHIDALLEVALPERLAARPAGEPVRVLCAGCASGEEPYTLAIALQTRGALLDRQRVRIHGIDVSPGALHRARQARYSQWTLRATPEDLRASCFVRAGNEAELRRELRALVTFAERNLVEDDPEFWGQGAFDVIFCRNVLMYLAADRARAVLDRFARALVPGGFLFVASSESLRTGAEAFEPVHTHDTFYYRRRGEPTGAQRAAAPAVKAWLTSIQEASARVAEVAERTSSSRRTPAPEQKPAAPASFVASSVASFVDHVLELLAGERFADAMAALNALQAEELCDARVELIRAVLLCHQGDYAEAERAAARALTAGDRGGAYYVRGLCREQAGDLTSAAQQYLAAALLDPTFAMPHLRLGLLAKRAGDRATAEAEFGRASQLLVQEQQERLILFGGGFHRWALVGLCETELHARAGGS